MKHNITLKNIEEIILSKQNRKSRYISAINSLFETAYNKYKKCYCIDDDTIFNETIADIASIYSFPDVQFEQQNLWLISKLVSRILDKELEKDDFFKTEHLEDYIKLSISFNPWDNDERWPELNIECDRNLFTKRFNQWYNSPIFVDEQGIVQLFDTFGDKRFSLDKEYFEKLDSAKLGTYLLDFHEKWNKISYLIKVIKDNLN